MYSFIEQRLSQSLSFLEELVNQNSFTPNKKGSDIVLDMLTTKLSILGFNLQRIYCAEVGDILIANIPGPKPILISAHVDTVHPEDSDFKSYKLVQDKAWGPGIFDMKGSISMLLLALEALDDAGKLKNIPLKIILNSDEETGSPFSGKPILEESFGCSHALVLEPARPNNGILTTRKGRIKGRFTCHGKPAHAGNNISNGANAIVQMSHAIKLINEINDPANLISANVGIITGGVATNVVPDTCIADFEIRFAKSADLPLINEKISKIKETIIIQGTKLEYKELGNIPCLDQTPQSVSLANAYILKAKTIKQDLTLFPEIAGGTSDANFIAPSGLAIIDGLGLIGAGAHTKDEYIEVRSLAERAKVLATWLADAQF